MVTEVNNSNDRKSEGNDGECGTLLEREEEDIDVATREIATGADSHVKKRDILNNLSFTMVFQKKSKTT